MTATSTFDVFSSLDGFGGVSGNNWGGYWGKQGPNCSTTASSCPPRMSDSQTLRELTAAPNTAVGKCAVARAPAVQSLTGDPPYSIPPYSCSCRRCCDTGRPRPRGGARDRPFAGG
jgi:hypothetical protein